MFERANSGHAAFNHVWIYLALILALLRMSERRTIASAALAGLCFGGTFLLAAYFGLLGSDRGRHVLRVRALPSSRLAGEAADARARSGVLGVTLLCLLPGLIAYKLDQHDVASLITKPRSSCSGSAPRPSRICAVARSSRLRRVARSVDSAASPSERSTSAGRLFPRGLRHLLADSPRSDRSCSGHTQACRRLRRDPSSSRLLVLIAACRSRGRRPDSYALVLRRPRDDVLPGLRADSESSSASRS